MAKKTIDHSELGNFTFADIDEVTVTVKIKGKSYAILPKKGSERSAKINRHSALYLMLDEHYIALPSIDETLEFRKILLESMSDTYSTSEIESNEQAVLI